MKRPQETLLHLLKEKGFLSTGEIASESGCSGATARRIAGELARLPGVLRVHGGIRQAPREAGGSIPLGQRSLLFEEEKRRIAERAMEFVPPNGVIFVHGGSTTVLLGGMLSNGIVITNSLPIAEMLRNRFPGNSGPKIILPGGVLDRTAGILTGSEAERAIASYHADTVFFSARGMDEEGVRDTNDETAGIARCMITHARHVIMLADHSKFHADGMSRMVYWEQVHLLITEEREENRSFCDHLRKKGVRLLLLPERGS